MPRLQLLIATLCVATVLLAQGVALYAQESEAREAFDPQDPGGALVSNASFGEACGRAPDEVCSPAPIDSGYCQTCEEFGPRPGFFGGADYLFVRPHFSEAIAFARGSLGAGSIDIVGQDLDFDYESSVRAFAGYRFADWDGEMRFTYWHLPGETNVNGSDPGAGQFLVDPFGNFVGIGMVIDPHSALFGDPIIGGDSIRTTASVEANLYDLDVSKIWVSSNHNWSVQTSAGLRIADIDQFYESVIVDGGGDFFSGGDFSVDFIGAGPRVGFEGRRYLGEGRRISLFAKAHGALLLGTYDVSFSQTTTVPPFVASQTTSATRTIPVTETEVGVTCRLGDRFHVSAGWLFQAWFDLGTSGGKFAGFFSGADDANIMSFDGLTVRGELAF